MRSYPAAFLVIAALSACQAAPPAEDAAALGDEGALTGQVVEHLAASPYLYLRLRTSEGEVWAAVPEGAVEDGATVSVYQPMLMEGFTSSALNRTFDAVYFGTLEPVGLPTASPATTPHAGGTQPAGPIVVGSVARAEGSDGRTVAEAWGQAARLEGKSVTIRGVVVKSLTGIMGKNWIHLRDGSGDAAAGTHDITVTTMETATEGETVTVTGTVRTNRDFGAGYSYPVLVEDARIVRQ